MADDRNYQPVMIKTLNQNNGKASKQKIIQELQNANPKFPEEYFTKSEVFKVLTKTHPVAKSIEKGKVYELIDYVESEKYIIPPAILKVASSDLNLSRSFFLIDK